MNKKVQFLTQAAVIAALYVVLTFLANALGLASGSIQVRLSESLTILPYFTPAAIPGLFLGCLLSNFLTGCCMVDIICGSMATLMGALLTYLLRRHKYMMTLPPVATNAIIVPFVLKYGYGVTLPIPFLIVTVAIGELISCCVLGTFLRKIIMPYRYIIFGIADKNDTAH